MSDLLIQQIRSLDASRRVALLNGLSYTALSTHRCKPLMVMTETLWQFPDYEFEPEHIDEMLVACFQHARCPANPNRENAIAVFGYSTTLIGQIWCQSSGHIATQELAAASASSLLNSLERTVNLSCVWPKNHVEIAISKLATTSDAPRVSELRNAVVELLQPPRSQTDK